MSGDGVQRDARARLEQLRRELQLGESELAAKERELMQLKETMLRISGAVQVLEELLSADDDGRAAADGEPPAVGSPPLTA
jgi:prefoldin subunit 5